jgi:hypothetical protein
MKTAKKYITGDKHGSEVTAQKANCITINIHFLAAMTNKLRNYTCHNNSDTFISYYLLLTYLLMELSAS